MIALLFAAALWAGIQNALAGGGSFVTLPVLMLSGLDARTANIASTLALFPGQVTTGWIGRGNVSGVAGVGFKEPDPLRIYPCNMGTRDPCYATADGLLSVRSIGGAAGSVN